MSWKDKIRGRLPAPVGDLCVSPSERSSRGWAVAGITAAAVLVAAGTGLMANPSSHGAEAAKSVEAKIADREKRVAELDGERKRREDQLAELKRRVNASESHLADTTEQVSTLDKQRETLQLQVAELTGPVSSTGGETVPNEPSETPSASIDEPSSPQAILAPVETKRVPAPFKPANDVPRLRNVKADDAAPVSRAAVDLERDQPDLVASTTSGPVRVFIHVRSTDPAARSRARAVAAELRRRGVSVAEIRGVRLPVRRDAVRYFYDRDRSAVSTLQDAVREFSSPSGAAPLAQDFRSFGAPPRPGTIELWLS